MTRTVRFSIVLMGLLFLVACATTDLKKIKEQHKKGNYGVVISTKIDCKASEDSCNQMHLIKGDACYRLAKQNTDAIANYNCAIIELETGISLTKKWKVGSLDLNKNQTYENLSESIRERQDMSKGAEAKKLTKKLLETSKQFLAASPGNLAAIYYNSSARFTGLRGAILMTPEAESVCKSVNRILSHLASVKDRVADSKYAAMYARLTLDVGGVKPALKNCQ